MFGKKYLRKTLRGFGFFETILYLGLFSVMTMVLLQFSWNVFDLSAKEYIARRVFSDMRFVTERMNYFIRSAESIDMDASKFDSPDGKLVLNKLGSSNTMTISIRNGDIVLAETGMPEATLNSPDTKVTELTFFRYGFREETSEYVDFVLTVASEKNNAAVKSQYQAGTIVWGGASLRNDNL